MAQQQFVQAGHGRTMPAGRARIGLHQCLHDLARLFGKGERGELQGGQCAQPRENPRDGDQQQQRRHPQAEQSVGIVGCGAQPGAQAQAPQRAFLPGMQHHAAHYQGAQRKPEQAHEDATGEAREKSVVQAGDDAGQVAMHGRHGWHRQGWSRVCRSLLRPHGLNVPWPRAGLGPVELK
ncbi:hypothetical protein D9M68_753220 [compost metagenome]